MAKQDQNVQEISVHDKEVSALPPTVEGQDMSTLNRVVVPVPSFTDPHNPLSQAGSINLSLDSHPFEHSEDYGQVERDAGDMEVLTPLDAGVHAKTDGDTRLGSGQGEGHPGGGSAEALPDDREEWTKKHYKSALQEAGLPVSGNTDALKARFEEYEAQEEQYKEYSASDWISDIDEVETVDDLAELRAAYDRSGADYKTVAEAFGTKQTELTEQ